MLEELRFRFYWGLIVVLHGVARISALLDLELIFSLVRVIVLVVSCSRLSWLGGGC